MTMNTNEQKLCSYDEQLGVCVHRYNIGSYTCRCGEKTCLSNAEAQYGRKLEGKRRGRPRKTEQPTTTIDDWKP